MLPIEAKEYISQSSDIDVSPVNTTCDSIFTFFPILTSLPIILKGPTSTEDSN